MPGRRRDPDDPSKWLYEVKPDGYRCCAVVANGSVPLFAIRKSVAGRFAEIREALAQIDEPVVLDGEIVAIDPEGRPSFQQLQNRQSTKLPIVDYVFDVTSRGARANSSSRCASPRHSP